MSEMEALSWCLAHFYYADRANAVMHCAAVRFSPITFRLAELVSAQDVTDQIAIEVMSHRGQYKEDAGRE